MTLSASIFYDFNLPNSTTWFYFAALLAMAIFFKFARVFSMRNWDVVFLFLLVPGLLLLQEARARHVQHTKQQASRVASALGQTAGNLVLMPKTSLSSMPNLLGTEPDVTGDRLQWLGYLWLLVGSAYFFMRCLFDLTLVQRPALAPNLSLGGLGWLAGAFFICLCAVAFRPSERPSPGQPITRSEVEAEKNTAPVGAKGKFMAMAEEQIQPQSEFWVKRSFAIACHLLVVVGLVLIGFMHFHNVTAGMAAATFYLLLPYTGLYIGQVHHVWPVALMIWAVVLYRWPTFSGLVLGVAAATAYFPALVFPLWLSFYWKRGSGRFLAFFLLAVVVCVGVPALIWWWRGELPGIVADALAMPAWQPWKVPTTEGFWTGVHWAYRIPIFILFMTFVVLTACWPVPKNLAHVLALSAAVLIGTQFWYADQGGVYVLWYLPFLLLMAFRPNLSNHRPIPISPKSDWILRLGLTIKGRIHRMAKAPEMPTRV